MYSNSKHPKRKSIRLNHYDYSQNGAYFVTICTKDKELTINTKEIRHIIQETWDNLPQHYPEVILDEYVIMPNHVHGIIIINDINKHVMTGYPRRGTACCALTGTIERFGKPTAGSLPTIIRSYKSAVTEQINDFNRAPGNAIWQRNYHEHVIRNDNDLYDIRKYIVENPQRWDNDEYNPAGESRP